MTFNTGQNLDTDALLFLFDILYERSAAFTKQYFLGELFELKCNYLTLITRLYLLTHPDYLDHPAASCIKAYARHTRFSRHRCCPHIYHTVLKAVLLALLLGM